MSSEERLEAEFVRCSPWLQAALDASPLKSHALEHVWQLLVSGDAQIWPTPNAVCVTEIKVHPTGLKTFNGWLAGGDLAEVRATSDALEKHARELGCDVVQIAGRRGWLRAFDGYRDAGTTMFKDLRA